MTATIEKEFNRLAGKGVYDYNMINDGDRILVGLSGGKDSLAMLKFLEERKRRVPISYSLVAVHLDMGYEQNEDREVLEHFISKTNVEYYFEKTSFAPLAHSEANRENPCFLCSRLRRKRLFELARDYGCSKVALGHHRDDLIETLLLNIFYSGEISTMLPVQEFFNGLLTVIRPLCMVPEAKVKKAAVLWNMPHIVNRCPSEEKSRRKEIKELIRRLSLTNDKIRGNIFRSLANYRPDYLLPRKSEKNVRSQNRRKISVHNNQKDKEPEIMDENHRKRTRVNFKTSVNLKTDTLNLKGLATKNLSLKGLFIETDEKPPIGTAAEIKLELVGSSSLVELTMKGLIARHGKDGLAVDFTEIDIDSFYHLRHIVMYNADEPSGIDSEMATKPAF